MITLKEKIGLVLLIIGVTALTHQKTIYGIITFLILMIGGIYLFLDN